MSTEMMNQCGKCLESELAEIIQEDCLDSVDGEKITAFDFANYVI
jgi:bacterioferritin-associated ferredoxin